MQKGIILGLGFFFLMPVILLTALKIKSTGKFIYALYSGVSVADYYKEGQPPQYADFSQEIHVWKWDGTPVIRFRLDRPIFSFDVTSDNNQIIASSIVDVDKIFVAEIPWKKE